jgi:hypothetical protein
MGDYAGSNAAGSFIFWAAFLGWLVGQFGRHSMGYMAGHSASSFGRVSPAALACGILGFAASYDPVDVDGQFARQCLVFANPATCSGDIGNGGWLVALAAMALGPAKLGAIVYVAHLPMASA